MAPAPAMDASTSVASPLTPSKKENAYSSHSAINEHIKPAKNHELSRINESSNDSQPDPKGSWRSWRRGDGLQPWENEIVRSSEVQRKANVAQLYFLNHYFDNLRYLADRKARHTRFQESTRARGLLPEGPDAEPSAEYLKERNSYFGRERVLLRKRRTKLRVDQFHIITQVGAGGYGEVFLARKRDTGEICALKRLKKRILVKMDEVRHVLTERDILTATKTPWLVRLLYAFQDPDHVFLAMEYVPGGDFRTLLCNNGALKEEYARFYMAEMLVSVNELHRLGYIHRDLKPENFLVDSSGHVKLTDFGLASGALSPGKIESMKARLDAVKDTDFVYRTPAERGSMYKKMIQHTQHRANSIVGSPDYIAPEMLRGRQYSFGVDYWSLGCILYEFLCGFPPFSGSNPDETFANLKNWQKVLQRPVYDTAENMQFNLSDVAWDAITKLVDTPERRYSSLEPVQAHPFFRSLDLGRLRELKAPFIPELESEEDTGYFDNFDDPADMARYKDVHEKQKNVEAVSERGSGAGGRAMWVGFTFGKNHLGANGKPLFPPSTSKDASDAFATMF